MTQALIAYCTAGGTERAREWLANADASPDIEVREHPWVPAGEVILVSESMAEEVDHLTAEYGEVTAGSMLRAMIPSRARLWA